MSNSLNNSFKRIKSKLNKYWVACIIFTFVTFLVGDSTIFKWIAYNQQINHLKNEIKFYTKKKEDNLQKLRALHSNAKNLEKLVREQYLMTKPNEELFVIESK